MSQIHESRPSSHPLIDRVWRTKNLADGVYSATPDGSWDLILLVQADGSRSLMIAGQATKPSQVPYQAGTGSVVISFVAGAYLPDYPGDALLDTAKMLPNADEAHFMYGDHVLAFPTYENAEELVEEMAGLGLIASDELVMAQQNGAPKAASARAMQRHFLRATGTTKKQLEQIKRAQAAVRLLQEGKKPVEAAMDAGYADQPHLVKSLKKIMHAKPGDVGDIHKL